MLVRGKERTVIGLQVSGFLTVLERTRTYDDLVNDLLCYWTDTLDGLVNNIVIG